MSNFSDISESRIFKSEEVLLPDYMPEMLPHRESQIKQLANNLLPASKSRKPQNTFLFGPPGIGKTAATKFVFREFENYSERVRTIYVNCWDYKTTHALLTKIAIELGAFVQRRGRGLGKDEVLEKLIEVCRKKNKALIVCLDEVDQLIFSDQAVLYDLLRINQYVDNPVGLVLISNNANVLIGLEPRIRSSLSINELEFRAYSLEEMKDILRERVNFAFRVGLEEGVLLLIANHAVKNGGDVRIGLECLLKAGRLAEQSGSDKIKIEHAKAVVKEVKKVKPKILKEKISENEKAIVELVKERGQWFSGELYDAYCQRVENPVAERVFRDFVNHLADIKLLKVRERKRGVKGKTRVITKG